MKMITSRNCRDMNVYFMSVIQRLFFSLLMAGHQPLVGNSDGVVIIKINTNFCIICVKQFMCVCIHICVYVYIFLYMYRHFLRLCVYFHMYMYRYIPKVTAKIL